MAPGPAGEVRPALPERVADAAPVPAAARRGR